MIFIKNVLLIAIVFILSCSSDNMKIENVESVKLIIDPNGRENKYEIRMLENADAVNLVECLNSKESELCKFLPKYKIEISYSGRSISFTGNNNHIMDENGKTYKLLCKNSGLYNY